MKQDVLDALNGRMPRKIPSKETLDHPGAINLLTGFDVYDDTPGAYDIAWRRMGVDIHARRPTENARRPRVPGGTWEEDGRRFSAYGVYPTSMPLSYGVGLAQAEDDWALGYDTRRDDIDLASRVAELRSENAAFRRHYGAQAVMYHLYYTTLFMWPVVTFGWEPFLLAAASDPQGFDHALWQPWAEISRKHFQALAAMDEEVVFCHDDLAMTRGPVFAPAFYERYILSRYEWIMQPVFEAGKKLIFVSDGNIDAFLERLLELPIAGIMYENPATPYARVLATWGKAGRGFIGGVETAVLTYGAPEQVCAHTRAVIAQGREYPGFIISSPGGLPGNIPLANVLAYLRTRHELGCTAEIGGIAQ